MRNYCIIFGILFLTYILGCRSYQPIAGDTKTEIQNNLLEMVKIDQIAAFPKKGIYSDYTDEQWQAFKDSVFQTNQKTIAGYFKTYGYLGYNEVGKEGSNHFWLLVQHCDHDPKFQKQVLKEMEIQVKKNNADPKNYAYLFDRVQVNAGKKQLFGTQVDYLVESTGRAIPRNGLIDSANIDTRRTEYGLSPLSEYLNDMTTMHFEMNKAAYIQSGYTEPDLYKEAE
ncbi:DUF6624 domain-containing protein [Sphingobacterium haloxyli]|uniref:Uncharacterized protein n=1 Tax=Sphingobacterium haloxyli TaxID=2100533 RepID=A0A2S9J6Y7_9SPHI|nr:DUF6624 domain-containing protein [Sphingobacterium haloxyli]PRD48524.1 hypothetical protein C5745_04805 [Sphingobacterium haloxyli]